jgi:hypothetical protein
MLNRIKENKNKIISAILLIVIGVSIRLILHEVFFLDLLFVIAVISFLSGLLLGGYYTFIIPISIMIITDSIIGNNAILLFTWSGFAVIGLIGYLMKSRLSLTLKKAPLFLGAGIGSILIYDIWTNFGCWLGAGFIMYPKTISGLTACYLNAIPFTLWHLLSTAAALTLVLIPIIYLKEQESSNIKYSVKPLEKNTTIAVPAILMILAIISLLV